MRLQVATSQLPVGGEPVRNAAYVRRHMRRARDAGADVVHFCEGALSGYAGTDLPSFRGFDWQDLRGQTERILDLAAELGLWVLLGSSHPLSGRRKPHNCVYVIDDKGRIVERYDKRFCSGDRAGKTGDLAHYTPGDHFSTFRIRGIRCGVLICYDYRFPELYREYKRRGVQVIFHSYHTGNVPPARLRSIQRQVGEPFHRLNAGTTYPEITMPASMRAAAASNHVWISCANSSARYSCWPAFFVRADGVVTGRLRRHAAGILLSEVDTDAPLYEATHAWRSRALRGELHSGRRVCDPRSEDRNRL